MIRVVSHLGGQIERDREARLPGLEEVLKPVVRFLGRSKTRVLAHRPQLAAVHRGIDTAGERPFARKRSFGLRHRDSASTALANATSCFDPMMSGVRWCSSVGAGSWVSWPRPAIVVPPACSAAEASGASADSGGRLPCGALAWAGCVMFSPDVWLRRQCGTSH